MVTEFVQRGHTVAGCGRSGTPLAELARNFGAPHSFWVVNVASDSEVKSWATAILSAHGPPDLLLNNAAIINKNAPLWEIAASEFDAVIDTNIKGVANVIRHFVPAMIKRGIGIIVNFSSGWGRSADAGVAPYCATKWAIEGMTKALAQELPKGMAAVALNPGIINTAMLQSCFGSHASAYPSPAEWARIAVPFLLSLGPQENGKPLTVPSQYPND